jgi:Pyruvate/2-oxoacid:ferredoxin oxidoreductase delta subunit
MKVCPNQALQPALWEAGIEGLWTPVVVPRIGYCEPACTLCGEVCPTGAIWRFTRQQKGWSGAAAQPIRLGTAFYDRGRCLPWAMDTECIVCEEWCPTSPKAIQLRAAGTVRQPWVDPARCVGCGACEHTCPVKDGPAVTVSSVGESRSKTNQMLLERKPAGARTLLPEACGAWRRTTAVREFAAADLWKYVDGDAERYRRFGVERTWTATYRLPSGAEAVVDVHRFAGDGARRLFESEPSAGAAAAGVAASSWRGACFVRVTAYQDAGAALAELARAVEANVQ